MITNITRRCHDVVLRRPGRFALRVLRAFRRNQGVLLAGAVAYHMLLSIVPLFALLLVGLSHFLDPNQLVATIRQHLSLVMPYHAEELTDAIVAFLANRKIVGWVGFLVLLFFSSLAFTVLENAMSVIFYHRVVVYRRHFLVSAVIPYMFILALGVGVLMVTLISGALQALDTRSVVLFGRIWSFPGSSGAVLYILGLVGLILMLTAFYLVMPVGRISWRHALIGGVTAGLLWEIVRHVLVWYFSTLSLVNVIYGSFGTAVIALLSMELAAIILLLGAQVIAEFERAVDEACGERRDEDGFKT
jgi:YihY family inner membrane protein